MLSKGLGCHTSARLGPGRSIRMAHAATMADVDAVRNLRLWMPGEACLLSTTGQLGGAWFWAAPEWCDNRSGDA